MLALITMAHCDLSHNNGFCSLLVIGGLKPRIARLKPLQSLLYYICVIVARIDLMWFFSKAAFKKHYDRVEFQKN